MDCVERRLAFCDAGGHEVDPDELLVCPVTGETLCYECKERHERDALADIYADLDAHRSMTEAASLRYDPETIDVPF